MSSDITSSLREWGIWKRNESIGLSFPSSGIERKIQEGICGSDASKVETNKNGLRFSGTTVVLKTDTLIRRLKEKHRVEMEMIILVYVFSWSKRRIARERKMSRHTVGTCLDRGINLIYIGLQI